jgi:hypothetical protein
MEDHLKARILQIVHAIALMAILVTTVNMLQVVQTHQVSRTVQ